MCDFRVDVIEGGADLVDGLLGVQLEVLDAGTHDGQWRPQLVAGVRRELALTSQGITLAGQRGPDGRHRSACIDGADGGAGHDRRQAAHHQHGQQHVQRLLLGGAVLDHLDDRVAGKRRVDLGMDADGCVDSHRWVTLDEVQDGEPVIGHRCVGRSDAGRIGQPGEASRPLDAVRPGAIRVGRDDVADDARSAATKGQVEVCRRGRVVARQEAVDGLGTLFHLFLAGRRQ